MLLLPTVGVCCSFNQFATAQHMLLLRARALLRQGHSVVLTWYLVAIVLIVPVRSMHRASTTTDALMLWQQSCLGEMLCHNQQGVLLLATRRP